MTAAREGGEWSAARPGRTLRPGKNRYPFYRRLCGTEGRSGRAENLVPHRDSIPDGFPKSFIILGVSDMQLTTHLHLIPRLKMRVAAMYPLSHTSADCGA